MTTKATRILAEAAVKIIVSASSTADEYTLVDARTADADLLTAHINTGKMDPITRARAEQTIQMINQGQRRY